jgi:hypothetical protein
MPDRIVHEITGQIVLAEKYGDEVLAVVADKPEPVILSEWALDLFGADKVQVTVRYYTSKQPAGKDEMKGAFIRTLCGDVSAEFGAVLSEVTGHLWTDDALSVGGHDIVAELQSHIGEYVHLEIEEHDRQKKEWKVL